MFSNRISIILLAVLMTAACANESNRSGTRSADADRPPAQGHDRGGRPPMPDLSEAAAQLGVSEEALALALRNAGGPPPDFDKAAEALGVSTAELEAALPKPRGRR